MNGAHLLGKLLFKNQHQHDMQALLQGPPKPFTLPIEELKAAVVRAAEHGEALEPSEAPASSDPGSGTPSLPKASRGTTPVSRSSAYACVLHLPHLYSHCLLLSHSTSSFPLHIRYKRSLQYI